MYKLILIVFSFFFGILAIQAQSNPMFSSEDASQDTMMSISLDDGVEVNDSISQNVKQVDTKQGSGFLSRFMHINSDFQKMMRSNIAEQSREMKSGKQMKAVLWILLISFLYGIAHSLGPGHNKVVVFSYFLTKKPRIRDGLLLGNLTAFIHALSGLTLALTVFYLVKETLSSHFNAGQASHISMLFSFAVIFIIGVFLLWENLKPTKQSRDDNSDSEPPKKSIIAMAFAVGIVPCPGTMILVTFLLTLGLTKLSIIAALFMALGMGFTISLIAVATALFRDKVLQLFTNDDQKILRFQHGLSIIGALLIMTFGLIFFLGAW